MTSFLKTSCLVFDWLDVHNLFNWSQVDAHLCPGFCFYSVISLEHRAVLAHSQRPTSYVVKVQGTF